MVARHSSNVLSRQAEFKKKGIYLFSRDGVLPRAETADRVLYREHPEFSKARKV